MPAARKSKLTALSDEDRQRLLTDAESYFTEPYEFDTSRAERAQASGATTWDDHPGGGDLADKQDGGEKWSQNGDGDGGMLRRREA